MESWREELYASDRSKFLAHHGIKGQKWGIRRYQNEDGTLTPEGKLRYEEDSSGEIKKRDEVLSKVENYERSQSLGKKISKAALIGVSDSRTYDMARQLEGNGRFKAALKSVFDLDWTDAVGSGVAVAGRAAIKEIYDNSYMSDELRKSLNGVAETVGGIIGNALAANEYRKGHVTSIRQKKMLEKAMKNNG